MSEKRSYKAYEAKIVLEACLTPKEGGKTPNDDPNLVDSPTIVDLWRKQWYSTANPGS